MLASTLAILNANVVTMNPETPGAEAIFVNEGKIAFVGSTREVRHKADHNTQLVDAKDMTVVPGLMDCHVHMTSFGYSLQEVNLRDADSIIEFKRRILVFAQEHPEKSWITGGRWDQERLSENRYPTRWDIDEVVAERPVCLMRVCGHIGVVNTRALQISGLTRNTNIEGGSADVDETTGELSGVLRENALEMVWRTMPRKGEAELEEACSAACRKAVEAGLTCVHWMVTSLSEIRTLQKLHGDGRLPLRVRMGVDVDLVDQLGAISLPSAGNDDMLKFGFVKILADGSLGARTAALQEPYADEPSTRGMMLFTQEKLDEHVSKAHAAGLQLAIHAIGDRAVESVLESYEKALKENPCRDHRHRLEHCSILNPRLISRMKDAGLIASVQPHFVVSDFWAKDRVGESRARWMFPFKTLVEAGLVVTSSSDCPVESISPILGLWAAVARKDTSEEALTPEQALKTYTVNAAYSSFEENQRGSIEVGKSADFTVLSGDLFCAPPSRIRELKVEMTIVGGRIVYSRSSSELPS